MTKRAFWLLGVAAIAALPAMTLGQGAGYPITVVPPGKGPYVSRRLPDAVGQDSNHGD